MSRRQRSSSFPRPTRSNAHRCSRLMRQHGGEQSGLVTLTFDLLTLKVVSESRVTWATSVAILIFLGLSVLDLGPMYATDRQRDRQTDKRQTASSLCPPRLLGKINATVPVFYKYRYRYWYRRYFFGLKFRYFDADTYPEIKHVAFPVSLWWHRALCGLRWRILLCSTD